MSAPQQTVTLTKEQFDTLYSGYCELYEVVWNFDHSSLTTQLVEVDEDVNKVLEALEPQIGPGYVTNNEGEPS